MSIEDFGREVMGKPPKNRDVIERWAYSDEEGCSFDQQAVVGRFPLGVGLACIAALLFIGWASDDPGWHSLMGKIEAAADFVKAIADPA